MDGETKLKRTAQPLQQKRLDAMGALLTRTVAFRRKLIDNDVKLDHEHHGSSGQRPKHH